MPFFRQLEHNILEQQQWWKSRGIIVSQTDDTFCCPDWSAWESRTSFWWQLFNQLKYQSTFSYLYIVEIMFSKIFMMIQKFFKYSCLNQPEWRITFPATERWVLRTDSPSLPGRCLKGLFGVGSFLSISRGTGWNSATLHMLGTAVRCSFEIDEWIQWEQSNFGIMNREKKLLTPGQALLPAHGCLAFLLMASCSSQLPNAFSWCGKRIYSVFPSQKFSQAVFLYYYKSSLLLGLWQKRGSVQAGMCSTW